MHLRMLSNRFGRYVYSNRLQISAFKAISLSKAGAIGRDWGKLSAPLRIWDTTWTSEISVYISPNELAEAVNNMDRTLPASAFQRLLRFPAAFPLNSKEICRGKVMSVPIEFTLLVLSPFNTFADLAIKWSRDSTFDRFLVSKNWNINSSRVITLNINGWK